MRAKAMSFAVGLTMLLWCVHSPAYAGGNPSWTSSFDPTQALDVSVVQPIDGKPITGQPTGYRTTLAFQVEVEVDIWPATALANITNVEIYLKGPTTEQETAIYSETQNGWLRYYNYFDITKLHTSPTDGRYKVSAICTCGAYTYQSGVDSRYLDPTFAILKGEQIWYAITMDGGNDDYNGWLHYPYHWDSKGPNQCNKDTTHGIPVDGCTNHNYYSPDNPPANGPPYHACFDCSGFVYYIYQLLGITIPDGNAQNQYDTLNNMRPTSWGIAPGNQKVGDLVFYDNPIGHVGIMGHFVDQVKANAPATGYWTEFNSLGSPSYAAGPSAAGWDMTYPQ